MAVQYKHKRYWQLHQIGADSSLAAITFSGTTTEAYNMFSFPSVWNTGSPTITHAFADSNTTLVITYEFADEASQTSFKTAVHAAYGDGTAFASLAGVQKHTKTEWLHQDGSVSATATDIL